MFIYLLVRKKGLHNVNAKFKTCVCPVWTASVRIHLNVGRADSLWVGPPRLLYLQLISSDWTRSHNVFSLIHFWWHAQGSDVPLESPPSTPHHRYIACDGHISVCSVRSETDILNQRCLRTCILSPRHPASISRIGRTHDLLCTSCSLPTGVTGASDRSARC